MERQVHLGLKNGQTFSFIVYGKSEEEILKDIREESTESWYQFITNDYVKYRVDKSEIISIGFSMTTDEVFNYDDDLKEHGY